MSHSERKDLELILSFKKALLCYPPVGHYQRGEDRCQADIDGSATQAPHAPNDLGYIAAQLDRFSITSQIRDYPAENLYEETLFEDLKHQEPDIFFFSTTYPTLKEDMLLLKKIKERYPKILTIAKGSCFFSHPLENLKDPLFSSLDIAIYGESEFIIPSVLEVLFKGGSLQEVGGLILHLGTSQITKTKQSPFEDNLDILPFPRRDLIKNNLYPCPTNGKPMATIVVSRGCPVGCIFCLSPVISGKKLRIRSVQNLIGEIKECVNRYGIFDFFMRADTFTMNRRFVKDFCETIIAEKLNISWVANSTTTSALDKEMLFLMKKAGCWLIAFGIESGNEEIQKKIKLSIPVENGYKAIKMCQEAGIKTLGFFMIGLPWDSHKTLQETYRLMKDLDCDFIEVHIAIPYDGTPLNSISTELGLLKEPLIGRNYFSNPYGAGTLHLKRSELIHFRKVMLRRHYLRPQYIYRTLKGCRSIKERTTYVKYGLRLLYNLARA